jgi:hypothetical protein
MGGTAMININVISYRKVIFLTFLFFLFTYQSYALDITLQWDANTQPDLAGYKVYYKVDSSGEPYNGTEAIEGDSPVVMSLAQDESSDPDTVEFTLHGLSDVNTYYFTVTANDDQGYESNYSNEVNTSVTGNIAPIADAGVDQTVSEGVLVTLDGSNSTDSDDGIATYLWTQTGGIAVTLSDTTVALPTFTLADVGPEGESLTFELTVTDKGGLKSSDTCVVNVTELPDNISPTILDGKIIDYRTIEITYSEDSMQNALDEANYSFSPSLNFASSGSDITTTDGSTYRLLMASIPEYTIIKLTLTNITDVVGNALVSNYTIINDDDGDDIADDWETLYKVDDPAADADGDDLNNMEEYNYGLNPNDSDTDDDGLPDGWEVSNGLDPSNGSGTDGGDGDFDGDGWTNYEEYLYSYDPDNAESPAAIPPEVVETIPHNSAGITDSTRVPADTSFCVRIEDDNGIDITDTSSIVFTIGVDNEGVYSRDLSDSDVVRVVKLASDDDTAIMDFWVVYDRSRDVGGKYSFGARVDVIVDIKDNRYSITSRNYSFKVESEEEYDYANDPANIPATTESVEEGLVTITITSEDELNGFQIIYDESETIRPRLGPNGEIPSLNVRGSSSVASPLNLQPSTIFDNPVMLIMPYNGKGTVRELKLHLYRGIEWVYACSSYNTGGVIQPEGEGWAVPGSLVCNDKADPQTLEVQIRHFSGFQTSYDGKIETGYSDGDINSEGGSDSNTSGCFIATAAFGSPVEPHVEILKDFRDIYLLTNKPGQSFVRSYYRYSPPIADFIAKHESLKITVRATLYPLVGMSYMALNMPLVKNASVVLILLLLLSLTWVFMRRFKGAGLSVDIGAAT